jgi:hypothetical protein
VRALINSAAGKTGTGPIAMGFWSGGSKAKGASKETEDAED